MCQDRHLSTLFFKVRMPLAEETVKPIQFYSQTLVNLMAVERAGVVHDIHEGAIEKSPQTCQVVKGDGVNDVSIETQRVAPLDWKELNPMF